jgi:hypothetical protein
MTSAAVLLGRGGLLALASLVVAAAGLPAQEASRWSMRSSASADLWFHGLALARFIGFGAQPLYDPSYPVNTRRLRERAGMAPTALERQADEFRDAFVADSSFEVLHFLPLYMVAVDPDEMLGALDRVARDGPQGVSALSPRARFGGATAAQVLATPAERAVLGRFVTALREEWPVQRAERTASAEARSAQLAVATRTWEGQVAPAAQSFLRAERLDAGVVLAVPALGAEGRLFAGDPGDRRDNVVAVALDPSADGEVVAWLALKELAFPAARRALEAAGQLPADRVAAEQVTGRAAVHLGAMILERSAPAAATRYRSALARSAGCEVTLDDCLSIPPSARAALQASLR